jgi:hypothetical protein
MGGRNNPGTAGRSVGSSAAPGGAALLHAWRKTGQIRSGMRESNRRELVARRTRSRVGAVKLTVAAPWLQASGAERIASAGLAPLQVAGRRKRPSLCVLMNPILPGVRSYRDLAGESFPDLPPARERRPRGRLGVELAEGGPSQRNVRASVHKPAHPDIHGHA